MRHSYPEFCQLLMETCSKGTTTSIQKKQNPQNIFQEDQMTDLAKYEPLWITKVIEIVEKIEKEKSRFGNEEDKEVVHP